MACTLLSIVNIMLADKDDFHNDNIH
jgi:hypothetical protein